MFFSQMIGEQNAFFKLIIILKNCLADKCLLAKKLVNKMPVCQMPVSQNAGKQIVWKTNAC
jgi:hypothetical protein